MTDSLGNDVEVLSSTDIEFATRAKPESVAGAWLASFTSDNTRNAYRRDLTKFFDWAKENDLPIWNTRRQHIDLWVLSMDLKPATVARRLASVSSFFDYAMDEGLTDINPAQRVRRPKVGNVSNTAWLSAEEVKKFLEAAKGNSRDYATAWLLALGLRAQEIVDAKAEDLTYRQGHRILTVTGKGGRVRNVTLPPAAVDAIDQVLEGAESGYLSPAIGGGQQNRHMITRLVNRLSRAAGLEAKVSPHVLRHSAAVTMLQSTNDVRSTQRALGHASATTTEIYLHGIEDLDNSPTYALGMAYA